MPIWPFRKRRSNDKDAAAASAPQPKQPLTEKSPNPVEAPRLPRPPSQTGSQRKRPAPDAENEKASEAHWVESKKRQGAAEKENVPLPRPPPPPPPTHDVAARPQSSVEDITALPMSRQLEQSPHLRPVDTERPHIAYNFHQRSTSQTSMQELPQTVSGRSSRPGTLRSKRSIHGGTPQRRRSSKRRKEDELREEEIRAMSAPIPIPKRPGEGPLRTESKKHRSLGTKDSLVSLPVEGSVHSTMSGIMEQRGWEVGSLDMFSPRPNVRLSGVPQYGSPPNIAAPLPLSRNSSNRDRDRDKRPVIKTERKRQTIGDQADDFDASDLRLLLERDAKRREKRRKEQQEKLDRKLRSKANRERGDSDRKRRQAEEARRAEEARQRDAEEARQRAAEEARQRAAAEEEEEEEEQARWTRGLRTPTSPPNELHPALRDRPLIRNSDPDPLGLGVGNSVPQSPRDEEPPAIPTTEEQGTQNTGTYLNYSQFQVPENPFIDPEIGSSRSPLTPAPEASVPRSIKHDSMPSITSPFSPLETPLEEPTIETAQAVHYSQANTPPLSPINTRLTPSQLSDLRQERTLSMPDPPPIRDWDRRTSESRESRRAGAWATFFRRGGTLLRKPDESGKSSPSEFSFSNASRESMRNQPLPAHLAGDNQPSAQRSKSGTPVRTQSKFREDLPGMPISPPDSRVQSPDVTTMAAAVAAARRAKRSPRPAESDAADEAEQEHSATTRNDTPFSQAGRGHVLASASLASIGSEGSWLAGGPGKRASNTSALSRSMGSLSKRRSEWTASYEELGGDRDAEYFTRASPGLGGRNPSTSNVAAAAASPDELEESDLMSADDSRLDTPGAQPLTVHKSVRRQPTLVKRDPRIKSREVLVGDTATAGAFDTPDDSPTQEAPPDHERFGADPESPESRIQKAHSVSYGRGHARQVSAGSAKLLDIPAARRPSVDIAGRGGPSPRPGSEPR